MRDAWLDLAVGSACTGCGAPGRLLCRSCHDRLPRTGRVAWPTPCPPGLVEPVAGGEYDDLLKILINAHKERGQFALARPLGEVLGAVVLDLVRASPAVGFWVLVPIPSRAKVVRARGHDPMLRIARVAAAWLRHNGSPTSVARVLEPASAVRDQAGLAATERASNLQGTLRCRSGYRLRSPESTEVVVVDDVVTTGSTAREAQRALEEAGVPVRAVAAVAATRKRHLAGGALPISQFGR